jgi:hypothetical protein
MKHSLDISYLVKLAYQPTFGARIVSGESTNQTTTTTGTGSINRP